MIDTIGANAPSMLLNFQGPQNTTPVQTTSAEDTPSFSSNLQTAMAPAAASETPAAQTSPGPPSAESVFGANPWEASPNCQGPNGISFGYNPIFFATQQTAETVANLIGGTVVQSNAMTPSGGPFQQQQENWMVQLGDGRLVNPGLVASCYSHGYPQSLVDQMVATIVQNS